MSGGSHDYICFKIQEELCGQMRDAELNDLVQDVANLAHDLEWADSCDISYEDYKTSIHKFKEKWFESDRHQRLKNYIDSEIEKTKKSLYELIGEADDRART